MNKIILQSKIDQKIIEKREISDKSGKTIDISRMKSLTYFNTQKNDIVIQDHQKEQSILKNNQANIKEKLQELANNAGIPYNKMENKIEFQDSDNQQIEFYINYFGQKGIYQKINGKSINHKIIKALKYNIKTKQLIQIQDEQNILSNQNNFSESSEEDNEEDNNTSRSPKQKNYVQLEPINVSNYESPLLIIELIKYMIKLQAIAGIDIDLEMEYIDNERNRHIFNCDLLTRVLSKSVRFFYDGKEQEEEDLVEIKKLNMFTENGLILTEIPLYIIMCIITKTQLKIIYEFNDSGQTRYKIEKQFEIDTDQDYVQESLLLFQSQQGDYLELGPVSYKLHYKKKQNKEEFFTIIDQKNNFSLLISNKDAQKVVESINYLTEPQKMEDISHIGDNKVGDNELPDICQSDSDSSFSSSSSEDEEVKLNNILFSLPGQQSKLTSNKDQDMQLIGPKYMQMFKVLKFYFHIETRYQLKRKIDESNVNPHKNLNFLDIKDQDKLMQQTINNHTHSHHTHINKIEFKTVQGDTITLLSDEKDHCIEMITKQSRASRRISQQKQEQIRLSGQNQLQLGIQQHIQDLFHSKKFLFKINYIENESGDFKFTEEKNDIYFVPQDSLIVPQLKKFFVKSGIIYKEFYEFKISNVEEDDENEKSIRNKNKFQISQMAIGSQLKLFHQNSIALGANRQNQSSNTDLNKSQQKKSSIQFRQGSLMHIIYDKVEQNINQAQLIKQKDNTMFIWLILDFQKQGRLQLVRESLDSYKDKCHSKLRLSAIQHDSNLAQNEDEDNSTQEYISKLQYISTNYNNKYGDLIIKDDKKNTFRLKNRDKVLAQLQQISSNSSIYFEEVLRQVEFQEKEQGLLKFQIDFYHSQQIQIVQKGKVLEKIKSYIKFDINKQQFETNKKTYKLSDEFKNTTFLQQVIDIFNVAGLQLIGIFQYKQNNCLYKVMIDYNNNKINKQFYDLTLDYPLPEQCEDFDIIMNLNYMEMKQNPEIIQYAFNGFNFTNFFLETLGCQIIKESNQIEKQIFDMQYVKYESKELLGWIKLIDQEQKSLKIREIQNGQNIMTLLKYMCDPPKIPLLILKEYKKALKRTGQQQYKDQGELQIYQKFQKELENLEKLKKKNKNKNNSKQIDQQEEQIFQKYENILTKKKQQDFTNQRDYTFANQLKHQFVDVSINSNLITIQSKFNSQFYNFCVFQNENDSSQNLKLEYHIQSMKYTVGIGLCKKQILKYHNFQMKGSVMGQSCQLIFSNGIVYPQKQIKQDIKKESPVLTTIKEDIQIFTEKDNNQQDKQSEQENAQLLDKQKKDQSQQQEEEEQNQKLIFQQGDKIIFSVDEVQKQMVIQKITQKSEKEIKKIKKVKGQTTVTVNIQEYRFEIENKIDFEQGLLYPCITLQGQGDNVFVKGINTEIKGDQVIEIDKNNRKSQDIQKSIIQQETTTLHTEFSNDLQILEEKEKNETIFNLSIVKQGVILQPKILVNQSYKFSFFIKNMNQQSKLAIGLCRKQDIIDNQYTLSQNQQKQNVFLLYSDGSKIYRENNKDKDEIKDKLKSQEELQNSNSQKKEKENSNLKEVQEITSSDQASTQIKKYDKNQDSQQNSKQDKNQNSQLNSKQIKNQQAQKEKEFIFEKGDIVTCEVTPEKIKFSKPSSNIINKILGKKEETYIELNKDIFQEGDLHPCCFLSTEDDIIEFGSLDDIDLSANQDNWMQNFTVGGRSPVAALVFLGQMLAGINEIALYWINYYYNMDEYDKIENGEMLKDMTFFILLFSPVVQFFSWMLIIGQVKQKLPQNRHQYQDSEEAVKNITDPIEENKVKAQIEGSNFFYLFKWIFNSIHQAILISLLIQIKSGPFLLHLYIMKTKNIVLTPLLSEKMLAQSQLGENSDENQNQENKNIIPQQATIDYNLKCNWATYFFHSDVKTYLEMSNTIQTLLLSAPMVVVQYITYQMTDNWNIATTISFIQSLFQTFVEIIKLFNIIFKSKVELYYLLDNQEENDEIFKLKRNLQITNFNELISVAQIKDEAFSQIKSLEVNLSNNKRFRKLIPEVLEVIQSKFKKNGLILEQFQTDISTCGIFKKKRMEKYINYVFEVKKLTVDNIKNKKHEQEDFYYYFNEQEYKLHFPNNDHRVEKINLIEIEKRFKYDDTFREIMLSKFINYNKKKLNLEIDSRFIIDLKTFKFVQYLGIEQTTQEPCQSLKFNHQLKKGIIQEVQQNVIQYKKNLQEYRVFGHNDKNDMLYYLKIQFAQKNLPQINLELIQVQKYFHSLKQLDLFINIKQVQTTDHKDFKRLEMAVYRIIKQQGNLTHLSVQFGQKSNKHFKSISQVKDEVELYKDLKKNLEKLKVMNIQIETNVDECDDQMTTDDIKNYFYQIHEENQKILNKGIKNDKPKDFLHNQLNHMNHLLHDVNDIIHLNHSHQNEINTLATQMLQELEIYIIYNDLPQHCTIEFKKETASKSLYIDNKNQIQYFYQEFKGEENNEEEAEKDEDLNDSKLNLFSQKNILQTQNQETIKEHHNIIETQDVQALEQDENSKLFMSSQKKQKYKLAVMQPGLEKDKMHNFVVNFTELSVDKEISFGVCSRKVLKQYDDQTMEFDEIEDIENAYILSTNGMIASSNCIHNLKPQQIQQSNKNIELPVNSFKENDNNKKSDKKENKKSDKKDNKKSDKKENKKSDKKENKKSDKKQNINSNQKKDQISSTKKESITLSQGKYQNSIIECNNYSNIQEIYKEKQTFNYSDINNCIHPDLVPIKYPGVQGFQLKQEEENQVEAGSQNQQTKENNQENSKINSKKNNNLKIGYLPFKIVEGKEYIFSFTVHQFPKNNNTSQEESDQSQSKSSLKSSQSDDNNNSNNNKSGSISDSVTDSDSENETKINENKKSLVTDFSIGVCKNLIKEWDYEVNVKKLHKMQEQEDDYEDDINQSSQFQKSQNEDQKQNLFNLQDKINAQFNKNSKIDEEKNILQNNKDNQIIEIDMDNIIEKEIEYQNSNRFCMISNQQFIKDQKHQDKEQKHDLLITPEDTIVCQIFYDKNQKTTKIQFVNSDNPSEKVTEIINFQRGQVYHPCCGISSSDYWIQFNRFEEVKFNFDKGQGVLCEIDPDPQDKNYTIIQFSNKQNQDVEHIFVRIKEQIQDLFFCVILKNPNDSVEIFEEDEDQFKLAIPEILKNNKNLQSLKFVYGEILCSNSDKLNQQKQQLDNDINNLKQQLLKLNAQGGKMSKKEFLAKKKQLEQQLAGKEKIKKLKENQIQKEKELEHQLRQQEQNNNQKAKDMGELNQKLKTTVQKLDQAEEEIKKNNIKLKEKEVEAEEKITKKDTLIEQQNGELKKLQMKLKQLERQLDSKDIEVQELQEQVKNQQIIEFQPNQEYNNEEVQTIQSVFKPKKSQNQWKSIKRLEPTIEDVFYDLTIQEIIIDNIFIIDLVTLQQQQFSSKQLNQGLFKNDDNNIYYIKNVCVNIIYCNMDVEELKNLENNNQSDFSMLLCSKQQIQVENTNQTPKQFDYKIEKGYIGEIIKMQPDKQIKQIIVQITYCKQYYGSAYENEIQMRQIALQFPKENQQIDFDQQHQNLFDMYNDKTTDIIKYQWSQN